MCYTKSISLAALSVGWLSCTLLLYLSFSTKLSPSERGQLRVLAVFGSYVSLLQLYDYIFWTQPAGTALNKRVTQMAILTIYTQPVVLVLCVRWFLKKPLKLARPLVLLYTLTAVPHTLYLLATCTSTKVSAETGHTPDWEWVKLKSPFGWGVITNWLFLVSLTVTFWDGFEGPMRFIYSIYSIASHIFSHVKYSIIDSVGRFWCMFAAFSPLLAVVAVAPKLTSSRVQGR